jgi:ketosteroid isomerase-like protein
VTLRTTGGKAVIDEAKLDVLAKVLDGFNARDADAIVAHFTDDAVFDSPRGPDPWGRRFEGKEAVRDGFQARFEGIPDVRYESHGDFVSGDRGVSEWTLTGTTTTGERLEVRGCDIWTFRDGLISVKNSFWKMVDPA